MGPPMACTVSLQNPGILEPSVAFNWAIRAWLDDAKGLTFGPTFAPFFFPSIFIFFNFWRSWFFFHQSKAPPVLSFFLNQNIVSKSPAKLGMIWEVRWENFRFIYIGFFFLNVVFQILDVLVTFAGIWLGNAFLEPGLNKRPIEEPSSVLAWKLFIC